MYDVPGYLVIDTETSGLWNFKLPADDPSQPYLAALAMIECDPGMKILEEHSMFVKPDGWSMEAEASKINGLTDEYLTKRGVPVTEVAAAYEAQLDKGYVVLAFNSQYDTKVMRGTLRRLGRPDRFETTKQSCLMRSANDVIYEATGMRKFPKLIEAAEHFGVDIPTTHTALGDTFVAVQIAQHLLRLEALREPAVHYAKSRED
jgi:DNA polymerase-3 subunit epsilon